ncbi:MULTISPECIES: ABC transporter permease subunit [unclassified Streptomyces]|uniref:ABC transporter permease subunit n=1 Tax=unclassified Streptomyces TaxID=2593676 RepID=UPI002E172919|nr:MULTISPECIES: ABC transporter permease subunit [unclassified Streptomyces]
MSIASYPGLGAGLVHPFWIAGSPRSVPSRQRRSPPDVESGTIELLIVRPVSRRRLLTERTVALGLAVPALNAAATLTVAAGVVLSPDVHRDVPLGGVFAAGVMGCGLGLCTMGLALAVSAEARRRAPR